MGRLCSGACAVMLLTCLFIGVLWAGSYHRKGILRLPVAAGSTRFEFYSYRGQLVIGTIADFPSARSVEVHLLETNSTRANHWDRFFWADSWGGFSGDEGRMLVSDATGGTVSRPWVNVIFPYWMILAAALLAPLRDAYVALRARHRLTHGMCATCGYACEGLSHPAECPACVARRHVVGLTPRTHLA